MIRQLIGWLIDTATNLAALALDKLAENTTPNDLGDAIDADDPTSTPIHDALTAEWFRNGLTDKAIAEFIDGADQ